MRGDRQEDLQRETEEEAGEFETVLVGNVYVS